MVLRICSLGPSLRTVVQFHFVEKNCTNYGRLSVCEKRQQVQGVDIAGGMSIVRVRRAIIGESRRFPRRHESQRIERLKVDRLRQKMHAAVAHDETGPAGVQALESARTDSCWQRN